MVILYKDNQVDMKYEISEKELQKKFKTYLENLPKNQIEHHSYSNKLCRNFILESGDVPDDYKIIDNVLMPIKLKIVPQILKNNVKH